MAPRTARAVDLAIGERIDGPIFRGPDGVHLDRYAAYVLGRPGEHFDVRAQVRCETWESGGRRAIVGARFGDEPFVFGLEGDGRLTLSTGTAGKPVADLAREFVQGGIPKVGRNDPCPCGAQRKFKYCHGR